MEAYALLAAVIVSLLVSNVVAWKKYGAAKATLTYLKGMSDETIQAVKAAEAARQHPLPDNDELVDFVRGAGGKD